MRWFSTIVVFVLVALKGKPAPAREPEPVATPRDTEPGWRAVLPHLGILITVATFVAIVWRIYAIANYNSTTAAAIVQLGGASTVALATAITSIQMVAALLFGSAVAFARSRLVRRENGWEWLTILVGTLPFLLALPWTFVAVGWALILWPEYKRWARKRRAKRGQKPKPTPIPDASGMPSSVYWPIFIIMASLSASLISWLPTQRVSVEGRAAFTAYVVTEQDGHTYLLNAKSRLIERVDTNDLVVSLCEEPPDWWSTRALGKAGAERYPQCP
jgi:hypothetical protein